MGCGASSSKAATLDDLNSAGGAAGDPYKVTEIDYHLKSNRSEHNTKEYEIKELILRRGQEFDVSITVDRPFVKDEDTILLQFSFGKSPNKDNGTLFVITPGAKIDPNDYSAVVSSVDKAGEGSTIKLKACFAAHAPIHKYNMTVWLRSKADEEANNKLSKHVHNKMIYVLFNPWCKDDTVYMSDKKEREEYVLNDQGAIYRGRSSRIRPKKWYFGQFDDVVLDVAMMLLDHRGLTSEERGNSTLVARGITALVNSSDKDKGVLTGNWSGRYTGGTAPTAWNGSVAILEEYMKTKKAVKYGQCWVFSGVTTTVCRALGLAARSVTNFDSAHDTDGSLTIDRHIDEDGERVKHRKDDSIWNFHVWNEAWFKRPELPDGNDGWQVIDATPQEYSDDKMQCGPAPLVSIKNGQVYLDYDGKFIFAEVNGDKVTWEVDKATKERTPIKRDEDAVGKYISTKAVGKMDREDITKLYKFPHGSKEEREAVLEASRHSSVRDRLEGFYKMDTAEDVTMYFSGSSNPQADFTFTFKAINTVSEERSVHVKIELIARYYTGSTGETLLKKIEDLHLDAKEEKEITFEMKAIDWLNAMDEDAAMSAEVFAKVKDTKQTLTITETYDIDKPDVDIKLSTKKVKVGETFDATISFTNPLEIDVTKAFFMVEGAGLLKTKTIKLQNAIKGGETVTDTIQLTARIPGKDREIIVSFNSRQLSDINGAAEVEVTE